MSEIVTANDLRTKRLVKYEDGIYEVMKYDFVMQGRGGSIVKLVLKNIKTGNQKTPSLNSDVKFEVVTSTEAEYEYMYDDGDTIFCVCGAEFPMSKIDKNMASLIGSDNAIRVISLDEEVYKVTLPKKSVVTIQKTEPSIKGQTAKSSYKPATLVNGQTVLVPPFIDEEMKIIVNTEEWTYESKAD